MSEPENEKEEKKKNPSSRFVPSLVGCLEAGGYPHMDRAVKDSNRLFISGAEEKLPATPNEFDDLHALGSFDPYTPEGWARIDSYCFDDDVMGTATLFFDWLQKRLPQDDAGKRKVVGQAIFRGGYTTAAADIEWHGVPIDRAQLDRLIKHRRALQNRLAEEVENKHHYGAYHRVLVGTRFNKHIVWKWNRKGAIEMLVREGIYDEWMSLPHGKTPGGTPSFAASRENKVFSLLAKKYEFLQPLYEVHKFFDQTKSFGLVLGPDDRNRPRQAAWWTNTGRTQPFDSVWPLSAWFRFLIKPAPGRAVAYVDLVSAEYGIAAALSGDANMRADYLSGEDVYEQLGKKIGRPRKISKVASLATGYGQKAWGLAQAISTKEKPVSVRIARDIIESIDAAYPQRRAWVEAQQTEGEVLGYMDSILGWRLKLTPSHYEEGNALLNFPMQAGCADIMRLAVVYMRDAGLMLCTSVHDAVLIEASSEDILAHTAIAQECWVRASRELLGGFALRSDYKIACSCGINPCPHGQDPKDKHQGRYNDKDGLQMWDRVQSLLAEIETVQPAAMFGAAQGEI